MKILFDNKIFYLQKYGGISNYFANLVSNLGVQINCVIIPGIYISNNISRGKCHKLCAKLIDKLPFRVKSRLLRVINEGLNYLFIKYSTYDLLHMTYYDSNVLDYLPTNKFLVITVYDMIHELFPDYFPVNSIEYQSKKALCERADKIIAISHTTKNDLMKLFDINPDKIEVIYLATDFNRINNPYANLSWLPKQYILFVGSRDNYKNFSWMVGAISKILLERNIPLIVIGSKFKKNELLQIEELGIKHLVIQNNVVNNNELQYIYSQAELFIFPSLYEGFGIPILESFAAKTALLLSDASCFPEIAKDGATYFAVNDVLDFQDKVLLILNNKSYRDNLILKSQVILNNYSWDETTKKTLSMYQKILLEKKKIEF